MGRTTVVFMLRGVAVCGLAASGARAQFCEPRWSARFGPLGLNGSVHAIAVVGEGPGASLLVGGFFSMAGQLPAAGIARWDGARWSALGADPPSVMDVMAVAQVREN